MQEHNAKSNQKIEFANAAGNAGRVRTYCTACSSFRCMETCQSHRVLHAAARDLAQGVREYPNGFRSIEEVVSAPPDRRPNHRGFDPRGDERARRLPPNVVALFSAYADPLARLTAINLHRFPDSAGGFYRASDGALTGFAYPTDARAGINNLAPPGVATIVREVAKVASETQSPASRTVQLGNDRLIIVSHPIQADARDDEPSQATGVSSNGITASWTIERLSNLSGLSDGPNMAALAALLISVVAVSGLALVTVKDLRSGVSDIEEGLSRLTSDLNQQVAKPQTPELSHIAEAINGLAESLRINLTRQAELEHELRRSERLSSLGRLVAGVAHEVRNPLAAIKLKVQMARRSSYSPDKLEATFRVITEEIDRLDTLVRRLLELGRTQRAEHQEIDLCDLAHRRVAVFADVAARSGVEIIIVQHGAGVGVTGDSDRLGQVLDNLVQNGIEAMPDGGRLELVCEIGTKPDGTRVGLLSFEDTGCGIAPENRGQIFEPFFTGRDTGTGLGLAIAREIVEAHGGHITFMSEAGKGSRFIIELPIAVVTEKAVE
jgi:signal transduction histidine kinase